MSEEKKQEKKISVVLELPQQEIRKVLIEGKETDLITLPEAITEIYKDLKDIKKTLE